MDFRWFRASKVASAASELSALFSAAPGAL